MNGSANFLQRWCGRGWLSMGYVFLYLPIIVLVVFSFNSSRQDMVWSGFSLRWYSELMNDTEIISGFGLSLKIALLTACSSVVLGTFAAFVLNRYPRFLGRTLFSGMASAPLVMPEVIIGLSLLLMMVSVQKVFGYPERGLLTIWLGHTLLGMAYATHYNSAGVVRKDDVDSGRLDYLGGFAVTVTTRGFNIHTIGVILLVVGIVGFVTSLFFWSSWGGFGGARGDGGNTVVVDRETLERRV